MTIAVAAALSLPACAAETGRIDSVGTGGVDGAGLSSHISLHDDSLTIEYSLHNTANDTLVAFDRGWVADASEPREPDLAATRDDVQVIADGDTVEFGLRIIHDCHGNPQGEMPGESGSGGTDCGDDAPVQQRIAATRVEPGETLTREYTFDTASVWPDYPTEQTQSAIDLSGKDVRFCLGTGYRDPSVNDDLYPPDTAEKVVCGDPVPVP